MTLQRHRGPSVTKMPNLFLIIAYPWPEALSIGLYLIPFLGLMWSKTPNILSFYILCGVLPMPLSSC